MEKYLSWFLGPKAENAVVFEDILRFIVKDYFHWRKNYFPQDEHLISSQDNRDFINEHDQLYQRVNEFLAQMRRNFPFYNPRYLGHMLSDTTIPSMLGYFGGMLYNPNNVTTEAAPVTTEWEIETCNEVAKMIGYKIPPIIRKDDYKTVEEWKQYEKILSNELSWTHIASGGTLANIEALWVARCVKYLPLSIKDVCEKKKLSLNVKTANADEADIKNICEINGYDLINIKPNESIYLFSRYISAYIKQTNQVKSTQVLAEEAIDEIAKSDYSISKGLGKLLTEYPLAIFVSGSAHYSWNKAADLLGIGRSNIVNIKMTPSFRMDVEDLKKQLLIKTNPKRERISPLAVIGIVGTTEEGAVDPIADISDIRTKFEKEENISFWLHVDAAWGGYAKTTIQLDDEDECRILANKIIEMLAPSGIHYKYCTQSLNEIWQESIKALRVKSSDCLIEEIQKEVDKMINRNPIANEDSIKAKFEDFRRKSLKELSNVKTENYNVEKEIKYLIVNLTRIVLVQKHINERKFQLAKKDLLILGNSILDNIQKDISSEQITEKQKGHKSIFHISLEDRIVDFSIYTKTIFEIEHKGNVIRFGSQIFNEHNKKIVSSLLAINRADSVTIDPHKMGYLPYPCGIISFRNDRVRHFITQKAPYITSAQHNALLHNPPRHYKNVNFDIIDTDNLPEDLSISTDAFATFILEGSKPGASAAALWLSNKCIPLDRHGYGAIIRDSLNATRTMYFWMDKWSLLMHKAKEPIEYKILPISPEAPDLNLLVFTIKPLTENVKLKTVNDFASKVYDKYSIQAELGDEKYSYAQSFFLSKTKCSGETYNYSMFRDFFNNNGICTTEKEYKKHGLIMLRATLMNPYIYQYQENKNISFIKIFMENLHKTIMKIIKENRL